MSDTTTPTAVPPEAAPSLLASFLAAGKSLVQYPSRAAAEAPDGRVAALLNAAQGVAHATSILAMAYVDRDAALAPCAAQLVVGAGRELVRAVGPTRPLHRS